MSAAAAAPSSGIGHATMKLLVDTASQRVLFAEAGKDVVDFLFSVLAMPVGVVVSLLRAEDDAGDALGSIVNVYASAEKMDGAYMQGAEAREALVVNDTLPVGLSLMLVPAFSTPSIAPVPTMPPPPFPAYSSPAVVFGMPIGGPPKARPPPPAAPPVPKRPTDLLPPPPPDAAGACGLLPPSQYRCHACLALGSTMGSRGFVQGLATYTIMDDLTITHGSNMSTVALLAKIGVKDLGAIEEKTVTVGRKECLEILKVSLRSKTVLTDAFLAKTKKRARTAGDNDDEEAASE